MKTVIYQLSGKPVKGLVIKENPLTVLVKSSEGKVIKRHKVKHNVTPSRRRGNI